MRYRFAAVLLATLIVVPVLVACGGGGGLEIDLAPARDSLPIFPGAGVTREGGGPNDAIVTESASLFSYDRLYVVTGLRQSAVTWDGVRDKMVELMTQAGWQQETDATSNIKGMRDYCSQTWVKCGSFVKDGVRAVVSVPLPLSFNPALGVNATYHIHLEPQ